MHPLLAQQTPVVGVLPDALILLDTEYRLVAVDPTFCRALEIDPSHLLHDSVERLVGSDCFRSQVQKALARCFAGESLTLPLELSYPRIGTRQFSVTYHPCFGGPESPRQIAMILRDVTADKLAHDGFILYSQWREALNAIDRAGLTDQPIAGTAAFALQRLAQLLPGGRTWIAVNQDMARAAALDVRTAPALPSSSEGRVGEQPAAPLWLLVAAPDGALPLSGPGDVCVPLYAESERVGELVFQPHPGELLTAAQVEMLNELAGRLERSLQRSLIQEQLRRYMLELERAVAERTEEIERRRQAAEGLRAILGFLNESRPLGEILDHISRQAELLLGADAIAVFRLDDPANPVLEPGHCLYWHSAAPESDARDCAPAAQAVVEAVEQVRAVVALNADRAARYRAQLVSPLRNERGVLGVILFLFNDETDLMPELVDLAVALGEQVALATENASLQERARDAMKLEERERLARELHDAVTQSIYSLTLFAEAGRRLASLGQLDRVQEYLAQLGDTAQQALKQLRLLLYELRPAVLNQVGLVEALRQRLDAVERQAGINASLEVGEGLRMSPALEEGLYRIGQEALNNALRHSSATTVKVSLKRVDGAVLMEVRDDGIGFVLGENTQGPGISHIRDLVARLDAALLIETAPEHGTLLRVTLPEQGDRSIL